MIIFYAHTLVSQGDLDWVIVRENSEGEYAGQGGRTHQGFDWEVGTGRCELHNDVGHIYNSLQSWPSSAAMRLGASFDSHSGSQRSETESSSHS